MKSKDRTPTDDDGKPIHDWKEQLLEFAQMKHDRRKLAKKSAENKDMPQTAIGGDLNEADQKLTKSPPKERT